MYISFLLNRNMHLFRAIVDYKECNTWIHIDRGIPGGDTLPPALITCFGTPRQNEIKTVLGE